MDINEDKHNEHHRWIDVKIDEDKIANDRKEKVKTSIISSLSIAIILAISSIVLEFFKGDK